MNENEKLQSLQVLDNFLCEDGEEFYEKESQL